MPHFLVGYSFGTVDLGIIVAKMCEHILFHGGFRFVMLKYYFGISGRSSLPDVLADSYLDTTISDRWPQSISFECREIRKRKCYYHYECLFCVRIVFDRSVCGHVVKLCQLYRVGHVVNLSSIVGHVKFEADLSVEERSQLANFGQNGYTGLQSNTALSRLFPSRIYDSDMCYRVVKKVRNLPYGDATGCILKLVELENYHSAKGGIFEMVSDRGGRSKSLH